jgi:hypothetical protein
MMIMMTDEANGKANHHIIHSGYVFLYLIKIKDHKQYNLN